MSLADAAHPAGELALPQLRARRNVKWRRYPDGVLPCWVAEMDFGVAPAIQDAVRFLVETGDYGYPARGEESVDLLLGQAFKRRMESRFGWSADPAGVVACSDLVQACFASVLAFSDPGDKVVVQTPCYPPFRRAVLDTGRVLLANPLTDDGTRFVIDVASLADSLDPRTRVLLFCHPHNPTGRAFGRDELEEVGRLAVKHDLVVVSDEIHADLVFPDRRHIPFASLSQEVAARTVTLASATKSFNIPGLRCGVMHFGSGQLKARFDGRMPRRLLGSQASAGIDATVAAWDHGQPWLDQTLAALQARRDQLADVLRSELPAVSMHLPEATYLAWLDCSALNCRYRLASSFSSGQKLPPARARTLIRPAHRTSG